MRTNIEIDDDLMAEAMRAGPYHTKKDAVEAGLKLLARQAAYREILQWEGKLRWEGDESIDWARLPVEPEAGSQAQPHEPVAAESKASYASDPKAPPRAAGRNPDRRRGRR
jgi:Arc/MetJ family transcription regulator